MRLLGGKPLIVWTIEAAHRAPSVGRLVVSTDDAEIAAVSSAAGAEVVLRPAELATDAAPTEPAVFHVLQELARHGFDPPDAVVLLQCTSPLRGATEIEACLGLLRQTACDAVMTVTPAQHWYLSGTIDSDRRFQAEYDYHKRPRSQDMPHKYRENGAVYATRMNAMQEYRNRLGGDVRVVIMDPLRSVDIDTEADFALAEEALRGIEVT